MRRRTPLHTVSPSPHRGSRQQAFGFLQARCPVAGAPRYVRPTSATQPTRLIAPALSTFAPLIRREPVVSRRIGRFHDVSIRSAESFESIGVLARRILRKRPTPWTPRHPPGLPPRRFRSGLFTVGFGGSRSLRVCPRERATPERRSVTPSIGNALRVPTPLSEGTTSLLAK